ncbi:MAG: hypothetical protein IJI38_08565, partial [Clostridia bacterium]|nr:hypothetical protein [Clostridia bacterium]
EKRTAQPDRVYAPKCRILPGKCTMTDSPTASGRATPESAEQMEQRGAWIKKLQFQLKGG